MHPIWLLLLSGVIALVPVLVGLCTAYLKVSIVLGMLRNALGTQGAPSGLIVVALSLALTLFITAPNIARSIAAVEKMPEIALERVPDQGSVLAIQAVVTPWIDFMKSHVGERELAAFRDLRYQEESATDSEAEHLIVEWQVLVPAFVVTELKEAFSMAFMLLVPFLVVDLIVANLLVGLGMFMVSPVMIALPLKLFLFVVTDGWLLLTRSLVLSYGGGASV